jgi:hypothetical protein
MATFANLNLRGAHILNALKVRFRHSAHVLNTGTRLILHRTRILEAGSIIEINPKKQKSPIKTTGLLVIP